MVSRRLVFVTTLCLLAAGAAHAQPLATLWPANVGNHWEYDALLQELGFADETFAVTLELTASIVVNGDVEVQTLEAFQAPPTKARAPESLSGFWQTLWRARPDLRAKIEQVAPRKGAADYIPFDLVGEGLFRSAPAAVGLWREDLNGWAVWYLTDDLTVGATFTLQLVPDLANDVFLHGTVEALDASVTVPAGAFNDAVEVSYRVDFGVGQVTDVDGNVLGTATAETNAVAHYVPFLGLTRYQEDYGIVTVDCPSGCPDVEALAGVISRHGLLELRLKTVATAARTWGAVKSDFVD